MDMSAAVTLLLSLLLLLLSGGVDSCGLTVHTEVGWRALEYYDFSSEVFAPGDIKRILLENLGSFEAGTVYPDFFYTGLCGDHAQAAEDAHWGPYFASAVTYFRRTYPQPFLGNPDAESLLAFLLGIASHSVSDVSWHSLEGLRDGLMRAIADVDFDGSFDDAHSLMDTGGDIIGIYVWNTSYADQWYIPSEDLHNILIEHYGHDDNITAEDIEECAVLFHALRTTEQTGAAVLYPTVAKMSATFVDVFETYFLGGVIDMASWTRLVWDTYLDMILHGVENCEIADNPMVIQCQNRKNILNKASSAGESRGEKDVNKRKRDYFEKLMSMLGSTELSHDDLVVEKTNRGLYVSTSGIEERKEEKKITHADISRAPTTTLYTEQAYAELGYSLAQYGQEGLLIGAPGYMTFSSHHQGCVFVFNGPLTDLPVLSRVEDSASHKLCDDQFLYSRFGHSVASADIDGDGFDDVIVGAPSSGSPDITYEGSVWVFFGDQEDTFVRRQVLKLQPEGDYQNANYGNHVVAVADLVVASASHFSPDSITQSGLLSVAGQLIPGEERYQWLGHDVVSFTHGGNVYLAAGSPQWRDCSAGPCLNYVGKVTVFAVGEDGSLTQVAEVKGISEAGQFGYAIESGSVPVGGVSTEVLLVSAPSANEEMTGSVFAFDIGLLLEEGLTLPMGRIDGTVQNGRFGSSLKIVGANLMVGSARYEGRLGKEKGGVFVYSDLSQAEEPDEIVTVEDDDLSMFGHVVVNAGDGYAVAAPKSKLFSRLSGVVYIY